MIYDMSAIRITPQTQSALKRMVTRLRGDYSGLTRATDDEVFAIHLGHHFSPFASRVNDNADQLIREFRRRVVAEIEDERGDGIPQIIQDGNPPLFHTNLIVSPFGSRIDPLVEAKIRAFRAIEIICNQPESLEEKNESAEDRDDQELIDIFIFSLLREERIQAFPLPVSAIRELNRRVDEARVENGLERLHPSLENTMILDEFELSDFKREIELKKIVRRKIQGQNYSGVKLDGLDFRNVDFVDCVFHDSSCVETKFDGATFTGTAITMSNFDSASMNVVVLSPGQDISGTNFAYARLRFAQARGVQAKGADFGWADLYKADFSGAELTEVFFEEANLTDTNLSGVTGIFTHFAKSVIDKTDFTGSTLNAPQMPELDFGNAVFKDASFGGAIMIGCNFEGNSMQGANFNDVLWGSSNFTDVDFSHCTIDNRFMDCTLTNAKLSDKNLSGGDFHQAKLYQTVFVDVVLDRAEFKETEFDDAVFTRCRLGGALCEQATGHVRFYDCDLTDAKFDDCELYSPLFSGSKLKKTFIQDSSFPSALFRGGDYEGFSSNDSSFVGATFVDGDLTNARFIRCDFTEAQATQCTSQDSCFTECEPAGESFPF